MTQTRAYEAIEVSDLRKIYHAGTTRAVDALKGISFAVRPGTIFGLLGPNGAGKTTTIRILTTLLKPTGGTARVMGHDVLQEPLEVRRSMCAVMQENAIDVYLSVRNNFRVYGRFHGMDRRQIELEAERVSELFGLRDLWDTKGAELSGGQKRRVQVAKTFMSGRPVVFLDEATTGMDAFNKRATVAAIKHEASKGRTIVLTTHLLDEAEELCESVAIVNHGRIIASGSMREVKALGLRLVTIPLTFTRITKTIREKLSRLKPHKMQETADSIILTVRDEAESMRVLRTAQSFREFLHFEVYAASLEDVFLELVDQKEASL